MRTYHPNIRLWLDCGWSKLASERLLQRLFRMGGLGSRKVLVLKPCFDMLAPFPGTLRLLRFSLQPSVPPCRGAARLSSLLPAPAASSFNLTQCLVVPPCLASFFCTQSPTASHSAPSLLFSTLVAPLSFCRLCPCACALYIFLQGPFFALSPFLSVPFDSYSSACACL